MAISIESLMEKLNEATKENNKQLMAEMDEKIKELTKIDPKDRPNDNVDTKDEEPKFKFLGEQLKAIADVEIKHTLDPRLVEAKAASGMNEGVGEEGGFLLQEEFTEGILMDAYNTGILAKECWNIPMSKNSLTMNLLNETSRADSSRRGGILTYWDTEAPTDAYTATKTKLRKVRLNLHKLVGLYYATDEVLADTTALGSLMKKLFAEDFGFKIDDAIVNGTGAGMPLGILNGAGLISEAKETDQTAATIVAENIIKMWNRMPAANATKAKWYINQDVMPQLMQMYLPAGLGGIPVFMPPGGLVTAPFGTLLGRPIQPIEQCAALGTVGDIIYADLSKYVLGQKAGGIKAASSIHVRFLYGEQTFRFTLRLDGQPLKNSAVTAYKGSTTRSPYVALATR